MEADEAVEVVAGLLQVLESPLLLPPSDVLQNARQVVREVPVLDHVEGFDIVVGVVRRSRHHVR